MLVESRIQSANILLITFKALAKEVAKNLVLAGIGNLTIVDHEPVTEEDLSAQLFVEEKHLGQNVRWTFVPLGNTACRLTITARSGCSPPGAFDEPQGSAAC